MIPVGPLHPADAVYALAFGLAAGALAFKLVHRWSLLVVVSAVVVMSGRHPGDITTGFMQRRWPLLAAILAAVVVAVAWLATSRRRSTVRFSVLEVLAACAAIWAVVPDTEAPLIAGSVLVGAALLLPDGGSTPWLGAIWTLPVAAAVIGSVGMPSRILHAAVASAVAVAAVEIGQSAISKAMATVRGRAGAPTTVVSAGTSSTTTAPAPMTAP